VVECGPPSLTETRAMASIRGEGSRRPSSATGALQ
jgi:hypothetical protein